MALTLTSEALEVTVTPERSADIVQIFDRATGIPTLSVSPTADVTTPPGVTGDSMTQWTTGYPGGWQFNTPNAGPERVHDGVRQGYHGESALSVWRVYAIAAEPCTVLPGEGPASGGLTRGATAPSSRAAANSSRPSE